MVKIKKHLFLSIFATFFAVLCNAGGAYAVDYPFSLTTTELAAGDTFQFNISAAGEFYIDCGTGGTLSGNNNNSGVSGDTITKNNTNQYTYTCTYSSAGAKTIRFGGAATGYITTDIAAISFNINNSYNDTNVKKISSISGSLGQIFGTIANPATGSGQPRFKSAFYYASNMVGTNIPDPNNTGMNYALPPTLFDGISGAPVSYMFYFVFSNCSNLTGTIPSGLFGNLSGAPANSMFYAALQGCRGLTGSIPSGLFGNLSGAPADYMFANTFFNCSNLSGSIPSGLFGNLSGAPAIRMFDSTFASCSGLTGSIPLGLFGSLSGTPATNMFYATFSGCSNLSGAIPSGLFGNLSGAPALQMFRETFSGCSNLSGAIPSGLFGNLSGTPAPLMFYGTFGNCSGLSGTNINDPNNSGMKYAIPPGLFGNLSGAPANNMFGATFSGCSNLTGTIPSGLFGSLSGAPANSMFMSTFGNCSGLTGSIPSGLFGNISGAPATYMFSHTFTGCSGLSGSIPSGLFGNLFGVPADSMFGSTFYGCSGLTGSIPSGLFGNLSGAPASWMFGSTFYGCSGLTGSIPSGLFGNLSGAPAANMFSYTFTGCSNLTGSIPTGLFGNISGAPASYMFASTFYGCSGLTGLIPEGLFGNLSGAPANSMFSNTFFNCSGLTGFGDKNYVPGDFLGDITTDTSFLQTANMFYNTQLANPCPAGTYAVTREQFNNAGKPWCSPCPAGTNSPAGSTNVSQCVDVFAITLSNYNASSTHGTIYEKYNTGWYNDFAATTSINTAPVPTRSGYTFRGFYATTQSDLTATGGDGTRVIDASGTLPANTTYTADTNLYASWAQNCNPGAGCTCNLIVNNDGTVTYQTGANSGYNVTSGSGTYAPVCSGNSIALTWDGDANGTPISCTYGGTFVPPTPEPRPGYVFTGWKVKTVNP